MTTNKTAFKTYDIQKIKESITIHQLLNHLGYDVGTEKKMICSPIRMEKTPSFSIRDQGTRWHDFGSGGGGDVVDLMMEITGCSQGEAIRNLAEMVGLAGEEVDRRDLPGLPPPPRHHAARQLGDMIGKDVLVGMRRRLKTVLDGKGHGWESCAETLAWLPPEGLARVLKKGFLGCDDRGRLAYLMRRGVKVRTDPKASRGDRWITGASKDNALFSWRPEDLGPAGPGVMMACEGESDSMAAIATWGDKVRVLGCMSCSIAPPMELLYAVARHCHTAIVAFDGDVPGREGGKSLAALLKRIFPHLRLLNYRTPDKEDIKSLFLQGGLGPLGKLVEEANNIDNQIQTK
jgi:hypothetical protein